KDDGTILGIQPECIERMKKDFVTTVNNGSKIYPPLYLQPIEYDVDGKKLLYIYVPVNPSVCRCSGRIFDRNNEADIDITNNEYLVYQLYARKQDTYYVNKVFPVFSVSDLRHDLIERVRNMTKARADNHPWRSMTDEELLRSAKLILTDPQTGKEGVTLAAILLFGSDNFIVSVLAHHKTDAIFRVYNTDRYDDRDVIVTNLLDSYDRLMDFGKKHMNDVFTMEGIVSVSARDKILREIVSNLLAHRDFSNGFVAKLVIEKDRIFTENANSSHGHGSLNLSTFRPFSKNPAISGVFREIGLADELGSGMRNTYKYTHLYSGAEPQFIEGEVFQTIIPLNAAATATVGPGKSTDAIISDGADDGVGDGVGDGASVTIRLDEERLKRLINFCEDEHTKVEMMKFCGINSDSYFRIHILNPLLKTGLLKRTVPDKPNSPKQKYVKSKSES
ncbi:MAG: AAA family ATPase, partial [Lachnospiraceae bacterium]|nr:AAA family ATPase [Lachnospiraceae bacterium]